MLSDEELQALADDIRAHGLKEPVTTFEGKILDGRNRAAACLIAGVELSTVAFEGSRDEALAFSWSKNRRRRQLDSSQSAIAEARRARLSQEYAAEVERMKAEAADRKASQGGDKKSAAAKALPKIAGEILTTSDRDSGKTRDIRAKAAGTNGSYIQIADKIEAERPDVGERILKGELTIPAAQKLIREESEPPRVDASQSKLIGVGVIRANEAVNCLKAIPANDKLRKRGFQIVADWIKRNL